MDPQTNRFAIIPEPVLRTGDGPLILVYAAISLHAGGDGSAFPSYATIASLTGLSRSTIARAIHRLAGGGHAAIHTTPGATNVYHLSTHPRFAQAVSSRQDPSRHDTPPVSPVNTTGVTSEPEEFTHDTGVVSPGDGGGVTSELKQEQLTKTTKSMLSSQGFDEFWAMYPHYSGRSSRKLSLDTWRRLSQADRQQIIAALPAHAQQPDWTKDRGMYVPGAHIWLRQRRWEAPLNPAPVPSDEFWRRMV